MCRICHFEAVLTFTAENGNFLSAKGNSGLKRLVSSNCDITNSLEANLGPICSGVMRKECVFWDFNEAIIQFLCKYPLLTCRYFSVQLLNVRYKPGITVMEIWANMTKFCFTMGSCRLKKKKKSQIFAGSHSQVWRFAHMTHHQCRHAGGSWQRSICLFLRRCPKYKEWQWAKDRETDQWPNFLDISISVREDK